MNLGSPYLLVERMLEGALGAFGRYVNGRVIDFGCGDFRLSRAFQSRATQFTGVDNWVAANWHRQKPAGVSFIYGSIEKAPLSEGWFDSAVCTEVLEHVHDPESTVRECARTLKDEGHLVLSMPFSFCVHGAPNDFRRYTIYGLDRLLRDHGLELVEHAIIGDGCLTLLNHAVTQIGFAKCGRVGRILRRPLVMALNLIGILMLSLSRKPKTYDRVEATVHDRSSPVGYVLVARKVRTQAPRTSPPSPEGIVCPECHSQLRFAQDEIQCSGCRRLFHYHEGVPVLAAADLLHLEHESTGKRVSVS